MGWVYLIIAGLMEIGWPVGLKMAQNEGSRWLGIMIAVAFMAASGFMLWMAQKSIPMGIAYAVWTSIGAVGAFFVGVLAYGDPTSLGKYIGIALIVAGIVVLKVSS